MQKTEYRHRFFDSSVSLLLVSPPPDPPPTSDGIGDGASAAARRRASASRLVHALADQVSSQAGGGDTRGALQLMLVQGEMVGESCRS
eukprot:761323-Hanusia_phi.AAC.1